MIEVKYRGRKIKVESRLVSVTVGKFRAFAIDEDGTEVALGGYHDSPNLAADIAAYFILPEMERRATTYKNGPSHK